MTIHTIGAREARLAAIAIGTADWLPLTAAPTFAVMAAVTGVLGGGVPDVLCAHDASPLGGMAAMYMLMSAFHVVHWLKLIAGRRGGGMGRPMMSACT